MNPIDAEQVMNEAVSAAGGRRVSDIVGLNPPFDNADYLFPADGIVAEMKSLEKDFLSDPATELGMHELYNRWVQEGKPVPLIYGRGVIRIDQVPLECARQLIALFKNKLESGVLRKANRQIRETRSNLNFPDALGLLLISNEGNFVFDPATLTHMLLHSLRAKYSSIDHVILVSASLLVSTSVHPRRRLFASIRFPDRRQPSDAFVERLGVAWTNSLSKATGERVQPFTLREAGRAEIDQLRFRREF
jgi:hypothetical protein